MNCPESLMELAISKPSTYMNACIQMRGHWLTPEVQAAIRRVMDDCHTSSPAHQAKKSCRPWADYGNDPFHGPWITIEFLGHDLPSRSKFMGYLESTIKRVIIPFKTKIEVNLYKGTYADGTGTLTSCLMIADELKCAYDAGGSGAPFTFMPEDNLTHWKVLEHCSDLGLHVLPR